MENRLKIKQFVLREEKERAEKAKQLAESTEDADKKSKLERKSMRLTKEMIYDVKHLLELLGVFIFIKKVKVKQLLVNYVEPDMLIMY